MKKNHILIIEMFIVVVLCVSIFLLYLSIKKTSIKNNTIRQNLLSNKTKQDQIAKISSEQVLLEKNINNIKSHILGLGEEAVFIDNIEAKASSFGLSVEVSNINEEKPKELLDAELNILNIQIIVKGEWLNIYKFINFLEKMNYMISVNKIDMSVEEEKTSWQANINLSVPKNIKI